MSRAIASARQRRAGVETPATPASISQAAPSAQNGLTLPQVISLVDSRLIRLEQFMKDSQENRFTSTIEPREISNITTDSDPNQLTDLNDILEEYNSRFVLLAEEIGQIKDTLIKLQTYTMDVNKMLLEERVNILSDIGNDTSMYVMNTTTLDDVQTVDVQTTDVQTSNVQTTDVQTSNVETANV